MKYWKGGGAEAGVCCSHMGSEPQPFSQSAFLFLQLSESWPPFKFGPHVLLSLVTFTPLCCDQTAGHKRLTSQTSWCFGTHSWPPISPLAIFIESYTVTRENAPSACTPDLPLPAPCLSSPFPTYLHLVLTGAAIKLSLTSSRPTTPWDPVYSSVSSAFYPVSRP